MRELIQSGVVPRSAVKLEFQCEAESIAAALFKHGRQL